MTDWSQVKWAEAKQVIDLMDSKESATPEAGIAPQEHCRRLVEQGELEQAVMFIGHALPRFDSAAWAAQRLEESAGHRGVEGADRQALDRALRWVGDPTDEHRRAAYEAAEEAGDDSPERLLGLAIFLSGGSLAPEDLPPVLPEPKLCGRLAASAVVTACLRLDKPEQRLRGAIEAGEKVASKGVQALAPR